MQLVVAAVYGVAALTSGKVCGGEFLYWRSLDSCRMCLWSTQLLLLCFAAHSVVVVQALLVTDSVSLCCYNSFRAKGGAFGLLLSTPGAVAPELCACL